MVESTICADHRTVGVALIERLEAHGVEVVFGIPGTHNLELYRGLSASSIRHVTPRHEQGGGYAADGYARRSGKPGVVITTTGPGLTNAMTAAATSYADSIPVLYLSPGLPDAILGKDVGYLHESKDQRGAMDALVGWSKRASDAQSALALIDEAFAHWQVGRPRPVHIEVLVDVLEQLWSGNATSVPDPAGSASIDQAELTGGAEFLQLASNPMLLVGGGARHAGAAVQALAETLGAPVVTTCNGKGVLDEAHPLAVGAQIRLPLVQQALHDADAVVVVGSELGDSDWWEGVPEGMRVLRIDVDPAQRNKNATATASVIGDATTILMQLTDVLKSREPASDGHQRAQRLQQAAVEAAQEEAGVSGQIAGLVSSVLPHSASVACDSSQITYLGAVHLLRTHAGGRFLYMPGFATLGYALPAAIGAALADPTSPAVALVGDGAFMFTVQELVTAAEQQLQVIVVLVDNGGYREIRNGMQDRDIDPLAVDLLRPDFVALATACGVHATRAELDNFGELDAALRDAMNRPGPSLIHVPIN